MPCMRRQSLVRLMCLCALAGVGIPRAALAQELKIYCVEVGLDDAPTFIKQGDATLVISPAGKRMLIDGGDAGDLGGNTVLALFSRVIPTGGLDYIVTSHWDEDHSGGLAGIARANSNQYLPPRVYDLGTDEGGPSYNSTFSGRRVKPAVGETIDLGGGCTAVFVSVDGYIYGGGYVPPSGTNSQNARSIGVLIRYGAFDYLTLGDLPGASPDVEGPLGTALRAGGRQVDVLHVSHHGSGESTKNAMVAGLLPEFAVISVGDNNTHGHPHQYALNHLNALTDGGSPYSPAYPPVKTIYTLERGASGSGTAPNVKIVGRGNSPGFPYNPAQQGSLKISVSAGGARYYFVNEGPNTNSVNDGPFNSDEGGEATGIPILESGDYNGDGSSEIAVFRASSGLWSIRDFTRCNFGGSDDIPASGDYNGDGVAEIAVFRSYYGSWAIRGLTRCYFGSSGDQSVPGDYDGDGCCDLGIFRNAGGLWAIGDLTRVFFGNSGDIPVPADYTGDGTAEIATFRSNYGLWSIRGWTRRYVGSAGDVSVPADYNGDSTAELAVFRGYYGLWAVDQMTRFYLGESLDRPVPADYDGNGVDDPGIFRDSGGLWVIRTVTRTYYGTSGDIPVAR
ncbi:MAG: MBL fold metallo-hydrolase [Candidatus Aureabacteria bacterium]|nr:MBL fold metallo-hydrolase [Candidatus Auribacterota bacterium]